MIYGPTLPISEELHAMKYRADGETFKEGVVRFAHTLKDNEEHYYALKEILLDQRFMGGGRTQAAIGSPREVTAMNCFVSRTLDDSLEGIMDAAKEAAITMKLGGGIGYDFSTLRPKGDRIVSLDSKSSGPISFMQIFDAICQTIASAGHRRGAQMGVLRVDHPDIEEFIAAKQNQDNLRAFNISIGVTDDFMNAVREGGNFTLQFGGKPYKTIKARNLWEKIMRSTWDWAEPGVLFIDRINQMNNLWYCEDIAASNPCAEQVLPPYGACLLGSFNLVKYVRDTTWDEEWQGDYLFDYEQLIDDIPHVVRAMDNIHDISIFPLPAQAEESRLKRRMGLGVTGVANAGEALGYEYGSEEFLKWFERVMLIIRDNIYRSSIDLAKEKGPFPLFDKRYVDSGFMQTFPEGFREEISEHGIRNSHLLSIAPTGTISLTADNISSGIEPVFSHYYDRTIQTFDGPRVERVEDYGYRVFGIKGKIAHECTADEHLGVLAVASRFVDSAVSKTINIDPDIAWEDFKAIYMKAWEQGCKGCTTFNSGGKRFGILKETKNESNATACYIDPETGVKECS